MSDREGMSDLVAPEVDLVNSPPHYKQGPIECIDAIESFLGFDAFRDFLRGQIVKYQWRLTQKGSALENAQKAQWYSNRLVVHLSKAPPSR
jgi:hypothetical protein